MKELRKTNTDESTQEYACPNCGKYFSREDLLRRHLVREARALTNPTFDRQKSCYNCAKSKARCDLSFPTCGRCSKSGKECVYGPHTGNPNAWKARVPRHPQHQPVFAHAPGPSASMPYPVHQWRESLPRPVDILQVHTSDVSGDELDGDEYAAGSSMGHMLSSSDSMSSSGSFYSNGSVDCMQEQAPIFGGSGSSFGQYPVLPLPQQHAYPQFPHHSSNSLDPIPNIGVVPEVPMRPNRDAGFDMNIPLVQQSLMAPPSSLVRPHVSTRRAAPPLHRLHTENLRESLAVNTMKPSTPLQATNLSLFSPDQTSLLTGNVDLSSWLAEPVVPSPLYTHGPSTGWTNLSPAADPGKTPTGYVVRDVGGFDVERLESAGAAVAADVSSMYDTYVQTPLTSPVLISAIDWWQRDEDAQQRFHRYTIAHSTGLRNHPTDPRVTLSMSTSTRFLAYSAILALTGPNAPPPPFFHRHLLMLLREKLPTPLAICRSVISAISLRQRSNDEWAWRLVGSELAQNVSTARSFLSTLNDAHQRAELSGLGGAAPELAVWFQSAMRIEGGMEILALVQSIWFQLVVGSFGCVFGEGGTDEVNSPMAATKYWDASLVQSAIEALQVLVHLLAITALQMQRGGWRDDATPYTMDTTSEARDALDTRRFMFWGFCETLRRTVLASYALLVLLRFIFRGTISGMRLGQAPFAELCAQGPTTPLWETGDWSAMLELELPSVAPVFEAENYVLFTDNERRMPQRPTLATFLANRPERFSGRAPMRELKSYFQTHDEFTNVCLSVLFGLTDS